MAALSAATIVIEAGVRSGSMTVTRQAHELGRAVGAVPGPVTSATSNGPHELLELGVARIVTHYEQITRIHNRRAPSLQASDMRTNMLARRCRGRIDGCCSHTRRGPVGAPPFRA